MKWNRLAGPLLMVGLAVSIVAASFIRRNPVLDLGSIDLRPGAVRTATFRAGYDEHYAIGLRMDQQAAKRLFPCMADPEWFGGEHGVACRGYGPRAWPVALSFALFANGVDITKSIETSASAAGGEYDGQETYMWQPAFIDLHRGKQYRLLVRSVTDGSAILAARPRLVVKVVTPGFSEGMILQRLAALFIGGLMLVGMAQGGVHHRDHPPPAKRL
jgi:hypothetical protein